MDQAEIERFTAAVSVTATSFGREVRDFALEVYARRMRAVPYQDAMRALYEAAAGGRMPSADELHAAATGAIAAADEAQDTADRIIRAISSCGWNNSARAMEAIGPVGQEVVRRFGGWGQVCEVETKELGTLRAQLRDSARSVLARAKAGRLDQPAQLPSPDAPRGLRPAGDLLGGLLPPRKPT